MTYPPAPELTFPATDLRRPARRAPHALVRGPDRGGPRVLVAFASRHGATREIAAAVVRSLLRSDAARHAGLSAVLAPVQQRPDPAAFDAVVLGSAVYAGRWLEPAWRYVGAVAPELRSCPTWLFSSGLDVGPPRARHDVEDVRWIREAIGARDHRLFPGRLDRRLLSEVERQIWSREPAGDFRDWESVRSWSQGIAAHLAGPQPVAVGGARAGAVLTGR